jgi:hypothetical protein
MNDQKILDKILDYLAKKITNFKVRTSGKCTYFTCPSCKIEGFTATIIPNTEKVRCVACNIVIDGFDNVVKTVEPDLCSYEKTEIVAHLRDVLDLPINTEDETNKALDFYEKNEFDLVPIARNQKNPIELKWTEKVHKNRKEWEDWLKDGLNIGIKTGKCSNITIVDVDQEEIPTEIENLLLPTLTFKTNKGWHLVFKYTDELKNTRYDEYKTDLLNDGKQAIAYPSVVDGKIREIIYNEIAEMPKELITLLKSKTSVPLQTFSERMIEEIKLGSVNLEDLNLRQVSEGNRNSFIIRFGGILRKEMNLAQTAYTLDLINKHFCSPPLSSREFDAIVNSLDKYISLDGTELAVKILNYLRIVEEANSMDIREAIGEKTPEGKQRMEKAIAYLIKEGLVYKKRRAFHLIKKAEWRETFLDEGSTIDFNMPYLNDVATFRNGDMIVIGAKSKVGKSHISLNIIKQLIDQGKKPHYISLESGNRFVSIAKTLGISEGQFKWCVHFSPENIEIEKNTITIIDWVLPTDYAETDKLFKHFAEQLVKQGGILICFVQLKQDGTFFAQNMISFFPALVTRYMYDDEKGDGTYGGFHIDYIREPKIRQKFMKVPCKYNWERKTLDVLENTINED